MAKQKQKDHKTNAMRALENAGVPYEARFFECSAELTGSQIARMQGENPDATFKTLVTQGKSGDYYVFMIPVDCELDLKKAATAAGEKAVGMIKAKELFPLTGYVHGGCSPLGMKKTFATFLDETAVLFDTIYYSGGKIGCQIASNPGMLVDATGITYADLTR